MNDTTLLPPTAATAGFFSHTGGGYGGHYKSNDDVRDLLLSNKIGDSTASIMNAVRTDTAAIIAAGQVASVAALESVNRNGSTNLSATERTSGETRLNIAMTAAATQVAVERNGTAAILATKESVLELEKAKQILERQAADYHGVVRLDICGLKDAIADAKFTAELTAARNAAAAQLEAQKNAAAVAMQIAECCCEQKALMLEIEARGVRDKLAETQNALLKLQIQLKV